MVKHKLTVEQNKSREFGDGIRANYCQSLNLIYMPVMLNFLSTGGYEIKTTNWMYKETRHLEKLQWRENVWIQWSTTYPTNNIFSAYTKKNILSTLWKLLRNQLVG